MRRTMTLVLATTAAVGLSVATTNAANATTPAHHHHSSTVDVSVDADGTVHMPDQVASGFLKFDVDGATGQNIQLVRPKHGATVQQLLDDAAALSKGDASALERDFAFLGGSPTGEDLWQQVRPGTYYAIDTNDQHPLAAEVGVFRVGHDRVEADDPGETGEITAIHEMDWAKWPRSIDHEGVLEFQNRATDTHFVDLEQLKPGVTRQQILDVIRNPKGDPTTFLMKNGGSYTTGALSPNHRQLSTYDLPAGHYALFCWWPGEDGTPHAVMGMVRTIELR